MKSTRNGLVPIIITILSLSACGPVTIVVPTGAPPITVQASTTSSSLPDLVVSNVYLEMRGVPGGLGNCVPSYAPYEIRAMLQNQGQAPAYNIRVVELSTGTDLQIGELGIGQSME